MNNKKQVKLIIPCRFAYLNCWSPVSINGGEEKYSICAIISKKDTETLEKISNAFEEVKKDNIVNWGGRIPKNLKTPLKDGEIGRASCRERV